MKKNQVVVIGAGLGGLSAAIRLASQGLKVQLFERNAAPGGKMNFVRQNGFCFDTGPSLLTLPFVVDDLFQFAGYKREEILEFVPIQPICRYFWPDETTLDAFTSPSKMQVSLEKLSEQDAANYPAFSEYTRKIYDLTANIFLFNPIREWDKLAKWENFKILPRIFQIDPLRTMHQGIRRFFKHPQIVQLFDRYATYNGSNPYQAPATLNIIPHVEYGLGSFYVQGGMYRLVEALVWLAKEVGVEIHFNQPVQKILHENRKITGVQIGSEKIRADYVISNADVVEAFNHLIDDFPGYRRKLNRFEPSLSGLVFLWGVNQQTPRLVHHNILFSENYRQEFKEIFRQAKIPADPTIYIAISSRRDPTHAPVGKENWFVLVNTPYLQNEEKRQPDIKPVRERVLGKMKKFGFDIANRIETEAIITPRDLYEKYRSNRGSIYGISSNSKSTAFRRPANRNRQIEGLYFAGGSTHPGGGVPLVILSGKICADLILERNRSY